MPALRLHQLPWPDPAYRVDLLNPKFEAFDASKTEDALRAKMVRDTAGGKPSRPRHRRVVTISFGTAT